MLQKLAEFYKKNNFLYLIANFSDYKSVCHQWWRRGLFTKYFE